MSGSISSSDSEETSFALTEQERILKSSNIFKRKEQSNNKCAKHPNKKAKYYVQCDKSKQFCSKCALTLALKGLKIEETQENQHEIQREQRINRFQELLQQVMDQCTSKSMEFNNIEKISAKQLLEHQESCQQFFDSVIQTANQLKQTYLQKFQNDHHMLLNSIQVKATQIKQIDAQIKQFQIDIEKNHENIVKKMDMKPFEDIMSRYEKRVLQTKEQLQECSQEFQLKPIKFEQSQILADMNKMCYNLLLLKSDDSSTSDRHSLQIKLENSPKIRQNTNSSPLDMKVFEILEAEDIYQSTCSNPIKDHTQSPITMHKLQQQQIQISKTNSNAYSNPTSTIQYSRRESRANTPESWHQNTYIQKNNPLITPNERESYKHNISVGEQVNSQKCLNKQLDLNEKYYAQQNDKQKTSSELDKINDQSNQPLIKNLSQLYMQKDTKDTERKSFEDRQQLTPKHQKNMTAAGPQTFKLITNHASQRSQYQYPQVNSNLLEQKSQKEFQKINYDSLPNQKSLTPLHQEPLARINQQQQQYQKTDNHQNKRSNSKVKQPSFDHIDGKRQFILANINSQQYTSQTSQHASNEDTLKERILKELCSHPGESIYTQVLKLNSQQKIKNQKLISKENVEQSTTVRTKNGNGFLSVKKQSYQQ
ncbi:unnamed protein product (macronuclear) [Paramecium tetraurelia]|uniref:B box-type domain-containing protein n=1 Tax=Paramecium tetraurelia TaxID=5888 RepID=A0CIW8_PARTE|nr:uncharacterized protein GSPATT00007870001 [Paramecium tetraurelia]CAK70735.1 unnamed protein product [Paramecium tetraurelia]|eukprot:XP_001438132.1 hypothetical protein (macronuclear) [Paramecium tetraurelia strain d4-2]